jgi:hypothetical protein
VCY